MPAASGRPLPLWTIGTLLRAIAWYDPTLILAGVVWLLN
jgi:hypothetical protein